jgi:NAD(P)-dependent dehydrogenase (short-subunit alcohol dehydrogenase family)
MTQQRDPAKVVLITGAAHRLGRVLALDMARHGWSVGVHYHGSEADAAAVVAGIERAGGNAVALRADLSDAGEVATLIAACAKALGPVSSLINNASVFEYDDIATASPTQWTRHLAVNVTAPVFLSQALAAALPAGQSGNIINIIDQRVWKPTPHFLSYAASKSLLWSMTQTLAQALAPRIRVNGIGPGPMLQSVHQTSDEFRAQCAAVPLGRGTTPDEIAAAVRFILDAPALTGQMIALDGGQHLAWATPDIGTGRG